MRHNEWSRWLSAVVLAFAAVAYFGIAPCRADESDEDREVEVELELERDECDDEPEVSQRVLWQFILREFPSWQRELETLKELAGNGNCGAEREFDEMFAHARDLYFLSKECPKEFAIQKRLHNLEAESHVLGEKFRQAKNEESGKKIGGELKQVLNELFDLREKQREREAEEIAKELEHIRTMLKKRRANRERIIERRFQELTDEAEALEW